LIASETNIASSENLPGFGSPTRQSFKNENSSMEELLPPLMKSLNWLIVGRRKLIWGGIKEKEWDKGIGEDEIKGRGNDLYKIRPKKRLLILGRMSTWGSNF